MGILDASREIVSRITFPSLLLDDNYVQEIDLNGSLLTKNEFEIGTATAQSARIKLIDTTGVLKAYDFKEMECNIEIGIKNEIDVAEYTSMGLFTVESAIRKDNVITLQCIDRMYKAAIPYTDDAVYPKTVLQVLQRACTLSGITLVTTVFANSIYSIPYTPIYEGVSCRQIFAYAAELAGGYAVINRAGQLAIVTLGSTVQRQINKDHYIDLKYDEVASAAIDKVIVKVGDQESVQGAGTHPYTVLNNILVQNPANVSLALYGVLNGLSYTPYIAKWIGDWTLDLGARLEIDNDDAVKYSYLLDRKLSYRGGVRETISAPEKSDLVKNSTGKNSMTLKIEEIKTRVEVIDGVINQYIESNNDRSTAIEQDIDSINLAVADKASQSSLELLAGQVETKVNSTYVDDAIAAVNQQGLNIVSNLPVSWEQGVINTDGTLAAGTTRIRTKDFYPHEAGDITLSFGSLYNVAVVYYDSSKVFSLWSGWHAGTVTVNRLAAGFFKVVVRYPSNATIVADTIKDVLLKIEKNSSATGWSPYPKDLGVDLSEYATTVAMEARLTQTSDQLNLNIAQVAVGGRNLLKNSGNFSDATYWGSESDVPAEYSASAIDDAFFGRTMKLSMFGTTHTWGYFKNNLYSYEKPNFVVGKPYTISFVARANFATTLNLSLRDGNYANEVLASAPIAIDTEWKKYSFTANALSKGVNTILYMTLTKFVHSLFIANIKIEEGNRATSWTPAIDELKGINYNFGMNGFEIKDSTGAVMLTPNGFPNEQNFGRADNVAAGFPLRLPFRIGANVSSITQVLLEWTNYPFRTYSKGAASGGASEKTSGSSSSSTSGSSSKSTSDVNTGSDRSVRDNVSADTYHNHVMAASVFAHSHPMSHTHGMAHTHIVSIDPHTHLPVYGILETPVTSNWIDIYIDGIYRLAVDAAEGIADITAWVTTPGKHTIDLVNPTGLKRIDATVFMKSYNRR